jgi:hypothetical protein
VSALLLDDLMWWGEDGQWIAARGHHEKTTFAAMADELSRREGDLDGDDLPSASFTAQHEWYRPMTWEIFSERHPDTYSEEQFQQRQEEELWLARCSATDEGAEPWTTIETGA